MPENDGLNRDALLRLLDLKSRPVTTQAPTEADWSVTEVETLPSPEASPTALDLDPWSLRKGGEILAETPGLEQRKLTPEAVADFFGSAFLPDPQLVESCVEPLRREFLDQLFQTPEYATLHTSTRLCEAASVLACLAFAQQFARLREQERSGPRKESSDREMDTLRAVGKALAEATREVEELQESRSALGLGEGAPGSNDAKAIAALFQKVRNNASLQRICTLAGRFRRVARSRQRQKTTHGLDDLVGVTLDGELSRLLPVELARLALPELESDTLRRLLERQCLSRLHRGVEPLAKGPILVVVDESGSMAGAKVETGKALALALAWLARQQNRWCALCAYSGNSGMRLLPLPPGRWNESALVEWLLAFLGRGSDLDLPVREMPEIYRSLKAPLGKTDLIFLTDAQARIPHDLAQTFNAWKRSVSARLIGLVIKNEPGDLLSIADEVHTVPALSVTEDAVGRVLSL